MPTGESKREPRRYEHPAPGEMLHVDVKKVAEAATVGVESEAELAFAGLH